MSGYDFVYTECLETLSEDRDEWCRCDAKWWRDTRTWTCRRSVRDTSALQPLHKMLRQFGTSPRSVPKTLLHSSPFIKCWDSSALVREVSQRHFGTDTKKYVGTKDIVPNCLRSEVSWVRSVRTPVLIWHHVCRIVIIAGNYRSRRKVIKIRKQN